MEKINYEGRTIWNIGREEAEIMLHGGANELYALYEICDKTWLYQDSKDKENSKMAGEYKKKAEEALKEIMQKKGYPIGKENSFDEKRDEYIHFTGGVRVHQLPFTDKWNIDVGKYLFDEKGELKAWTEVKNSIREDIEKEEFDLGELDSEIRRLVEVVKKEEGLEIQDVDIEDDSTITITAGGKEFKILRGGKDQGEELAREDLEDGELWKMAVSDGNTTLGLGDWIDEVLSIDGWENQICRYDSRCRCATTAEGEEVVYYRSN